MSSPKDLAATIHDTINDVTTAVENIHRSIADAPLDMMGAIEPLERPVKDMRVVQDRSITAIYGLIRRINDRVGQITAELLPS
jgi:hypothetical protein